MTKDPTSRALSVIAAHQRHARRQRPAENRRSRQRLADLGITVRSVWEARFAYYLQWLKTRRLIDHWAYESQTFWFEAIRRGTRSYLPDFTVWTGGTHRHYEVKGYMNPRSRTQLRRMKKYHPAEEVVVVDRAWFAACERFGTAGVIPGWPR